MVTSAARIATEAAERYEQLCSHASHMGARSEWTPPTGIVEFPQGGTCQLTVEPDVLVVTAEAETTENLAVIEMILTRDFERFGSRQSMRVDRS